ncbi:Penicillin-binding protein 4 [Colletotrichum trifolii]|uniref:Penicillin-binding protein 4 n=1 Tax=Colletotrichum trifolii TaxID=5466 RepID=A0A4R8QV07_COLTR|nr:Penicillin-binding protein 4 [Colletotrichum trifolii]
MSVTKSITAVLVLRAIDKGLFNLDSKVTDFLFAYGCFGKQRTTIRRLLAHTAGCFPGFLPPGLSTEEVENLETFVDAVCQLPPTFAPGSRCAYCPFAGYAVPGRVLVLADPGKRSYA